MRLDASVSHVLGTLKCLLLRLPSPHLPPDCDEPRQAEHGAQRSTEDGCDVRHRIRNRENTGLCFALHVEHLVYVREQIP